jgi:hypothetical protein
MLLNASKTMPLGKAPSPITATAWRSGSPSSSSAAFRPEIVESTYYLYHYTHDAQYLRMGRTL